MIPRDNFTPAARVEPTGPAVQKLVIFNFVKNLPGLSPEQTRIGAQAALDAFTPPGWVSVGTAVFLDVDGKYRLSWLLRELSAPALNAQPLPGFGEVETETAIGPNEPKFLAVAILTVVALAIVAVGGVLALKEIRTITQDAPEFGFSLGLGAVLGLVFVGFSLYALNGGFKN